MIRITPTTTVDEVKAYINRATLETMKGFIGEKLDRTTLVHIEQHLTETIDKVMTAVHSHGFDDVTLVVTHSGNTVIVSGEDKYSAIVAYYVFNGLKSYAPSSQKVVNGTEPWPVVVAGKTKWYLHWNEDTKTLIVEPEEEEQ